MSVQAQLKRASGGLGRLLGLGAARFVARGVCIVAVLVAWSAGPVAMLPFVALAALILLLWPGAGKELFALLMGRPTARQQGIAALESMAMELRFEVEVLKWAARRTQHFVNKVSAGTLKQGLPPLIDDLRTYERKLTAQRQSCEVELTKRSAASIFSPGVFMALLWGSLLGVHHSLRRTAAFVPLGINLAMLTDKAELYSTAAGLADPARRYALVDKLVQAASQMHTEAKHKLSTRYEA